MHMVTSKSDPLNLQSPAKLLEGKIQELAKQAPSPFNSSNESRYKPISDPFTTYQTKLQAGKQTLSRIKREHLEQISSDINKSYIFTDEKNKEIRENLVQRANNVPLDPREKSSLQIVYAAQLNDPYRFPEIVHHYALNKFSDLKSYHSQFIDDQLPKIKEELTCFLLAANYNSYLDYLKKQLKSLKKLPMALHMIY